MQHHRPIRVLFVCAGNICRSPMAEAVFRELVKQSGLSSQFEIASAGTGGWHVGEKPHPGTQAVLQRHAISAGEKRALKLHAPDLESYHYVIAMDEENLQDITALHDRPTAAIHRLLEFAPETGLVDVPDPYYNGAFDRVYHLVMAGSTGLLAHIRQREGLK